MYSTGCQDTLLVSTWDDLVPKEKLKQSLLMDVGEFEDRAERLRSFGSSFWAAVYQEIEVLFRTCLGLKRER